ncbi:peregrin-like [Ostrinia nubilalis]|uniref:peregrin-like n=1 Tax=Ostrinia nubilalis TaxID=29057 RepID=UPI0030825F23
MGLDFDVLEFCKKLRQNRPPPYQCPLEKCDKVYKSLCGLQYHLVHYDHDNPTPATPTVAHNRKKRGAFKTPVATGDIALQSPPKEALTFAEAQKVVQFEVDGKISRIPIDQPLPIMSLEEWEKKNAELDKPLPYVEPPVEPHVKLPEASFKLIPDYNERVVDAPPRPNAYIRFIEKSAEELDGEVEYDVDEEDTAWLAIINKMRVKQNLPPVSVDTLELLMDRLEKESYFQATQSGQQTAAAVDEDAVCCICMDGECQNTNVILFCDMCNLAVHQDCYGVPYIPEGQWLCRRCLQSPSRLVNCVLCPNTGGAFKQTDQGTWAHVVCALWIPEVRFANTVFLEPIDSIEMIPAARWKLQCMVCKQRGAGACIQCHRSNCYSAFHVTCAQQAGLYMKMEAAGAGRDPSQPVQVAKMAYCDAHTPAHVLQERRAQESEGDSKSTDLTAIRQKGREKIIQARRVLAMKRTWAPVVLVPTLPAERVSEVAALARGPPAARAQLMKRLLAYWTLKRHNRNGVPLLRRLQSLTSHHGTRGIQDGTVNVRELCNQLKYWQRIRQDLERARLLCELVRKRERLKAEYTRVWERCVLHSLRPERAVLHKLLRLLRQRDASDIFTEPVDLNEVPDYSSIVKHPMDLSTMGKKLERGAYASVDDVEADFRLMIDNCLAYNNKDTVFYKAGVKMREQCLPIFRQARRDVRAAGLPELAGSGPGLADVSPERDRTSRRLSADRDRISRRASSERDRISRRSPERGRVSRRGSPELDRTSRRGSVERDRTSRRGSLERDRTSRRGSPERDRTSRRGSPERDRMSRRGSTTSRRGSPISRRGSLERDRASRARSPERGRSVRRGSPERDRMSRRGSSERDRLSRRGSPERERTSRRLSEERERTTRRSAERERASRRRSPERGRSRRRSPERGRPGRRPSLARQKRGRPVSRALASDSDHTADTRSERSVSQARSERRRPSPCRDSDDDNNTRESSPARTVGRPRGRWRGRGRGVRGRRGRRGRGRPPLHAARPLLDNASLGASCYSASHPQRARPARAQGPRQAAAARRAPAAGQCGRGRRGRGRPPLHAARPLLDNETPTSGSETPIPPRKSVERTHKLVTPEKSPIKQSDSTPSLGLLGGLRKPTLLLPPSTGSAPPKSFGSDATLPTLSGSLGRAASASPKKKGRGRPRKADKKQRNASPDLFRSMQSGSGKPPAAPVAAAFLQYRGPPGEVGSDSDLALSRSSSSSSAWSQSCSSCTHYDDDNASTHSCDLSSSDASSGPERTGRRRTRRADASDPEPSTPVKGRGTRSSASKTPVKSAGAPLEPLQLVWAKCRGYPWYPALIIDPKIPKGFIYNGVPLPVPPQDVLNLKKNHSHEPVLYLVLFFDVKRTWQWLPPNKLELLGADKAVDQAKLVESRKPTERKAVKKAFGDAMQFRKQVDGEK